MKAEVRLREGDGPVVLMDGNPRRVLKRFIKLMAEMDRQSEEWDDKFTAELKEFVRRLP